MKARIRKTGEIVDVICENSCKNKRMGSYDNVSYIDSKGVEHVNESGLNFYWDFEVIGDDMYEKIRTQVAIAALPKCIDVFEFSISNEQENVARNIVDMAFDIADEFVKKLKCCNNE